MKKEKILKRRKAIKCAEFVSATSFASVGLLTPAIALAKETRSVNDGFPEKIGPVKKGKDLPTVAWVDARGLVDDDNLANPSHYDLQMHEFSYDKYDGYCLNPFRYTPFDSDSKSMTSQFNGDYNKIMWYAKDHDFKLGGNDDTENSIILRYLLWTNSRENYKDEWALPLNKVNFYDTPQAQRIKKAVYKCTDELKDYKAPISTEDPKTELSKVGTPKVNSDGSTTFTFKTAVTNNFESKTKTKVALSGTKGTIKQDGKEIKDGEVKTGKEFTVTVPADGNAKKLKVTANFDIDSMKLHEYDAVENDSQNFLLLNRHDPIKDKKEVSVDVPATTSKVVVQKVDDENKPLANVEFQLYKEDKKTKVGEPKKTNDKGEITWDNLPIGTYYVQETKTANDGYDGDFTFKQAQLTVDNKDKGVVIKVTNNHKQADMLSILENKDQSGQKIVDASNVTLSDKVQAKFLRKGEKYRVKESFYDAKDKDMKSPIKTADGKTEVYSNELTAQDDVADNTFTADAKFDLTNTKVEKIVAVPTIQRYKDGKWTDVKKESKAFDEGSQQQVSVAKPTITTSLHSDNNKVVNPYEEIPFTDITSSTHAVPNKEYMYKGKLMVVGEDGKATPLKDKNGKEITKEVKIKADKDGNIKANVDFGNIDTTQLKGKHVVAFEYLYTSDGKTLLAKEENPNNKDQTITVTNPKLHTTALINGQHGSATPNKETMVSDLVQVTDFTTNTPISLSALASDEKGNLLEFTASKDGKKYNLAGKVKVDFTKPNEKLHIIVNGVKDGLSEAKVEVPLAPVASQGNKNISKLSGDERIKLNKADTTNGGKAINTNDLKGQSFTLYEDMLVNDKNVVASHPTEGDKEGIKNQTVSVTKPEIHTTALIDMNTGKPVNADEYTEGKDTAKNESKGTAKDESKKDESKDTAKFKADDEIQKEFGGKKQTNAVRKVKLADVIQYNGYHKGDVIDATAMARDSKTGKPIIVKNDKGEECVLVGRTTVIAQGESGTFTVPLKAVKVKDAEKLFGGKDDKEIALNIVKNVPLTFGTMKDDTTAQAPAEVKPSESTDKEETKPSESTDKEETKPSESTDKEETKPSESTEGATADTTEEIDASQLAGTTITMFEVLTTPEERNNPENFTVSETDKDNKSQQVKVNQPKIQTIQRVNGNKSILDSETGKYVDTVKYSDLTPGEQVTLKVVETKNGQPVKTKDGKYLVGTKTFTPKEANGTVDVEMKPTAEKPADELLNKVIDEKTGKIAPSFDYVTPNKDKEGQATNGEQPSESTGKEETKPSESTDKEETKPSESTGKEETKPSESTDKEETKPSESTDKEETKPSESTDKEETKPSESTGKEETKPSESTDKEETKPSESTDKEETKENGKFDSESTKAEGAQLEKGEYTAFETMYGDTGKNGTPTVIAEHKDKNDKNQTVEVKETPKAKAESNPKQPVQQPTQQASQSPASQPTTGQPTTLAQTGSGSKVTRSKLYNIVYGFFH